MPEYVTLDDEELPDAPSPTSGKKEIDEAVGAETFGLARRGVERTEQHELLAVLNHNSLVE